DIFPSGIC
ncbi:ATP-dependent DNA helicase, partial [Fusarium oxysporum f. sp. albedinis]